MAREYPGVGSCAANTIRPRSSGGGVAGHDGAGAVAIGAARRVREAARGNPPVETPAGRPGPTSRVGIRHPQPIWDADEQRWISDAEVAEITNTAFASPPPRGDRPADRAPGPAAGLTCRAHGRHRPPGPRPAPAEPRIEPSLGTIHRAISACEARRPSVRGGGEAARTMSVPHHVSPCSAVRRRISP
jgi:hypothetical protein